MIMTHLSADFYFYFGATPAWGSLLALFSEYSPGSAQGTIDGTGNQTGLDVCKASTLTMSCPLGSVFLCLTDVTSRMDSSTKIPSNTLFQRLL